MKYYYSGLDQWNHKISNPPPPASKIEIFIHFNYLGKKLLRLRREDKVSGDQFVRLLQMINGNDSELYDLSLQIIQEL